ncbi:hypothetical protein HJC23_000689 [Cyclotella cryptica]|uniref:Uncharacterized protein n=1 Tax=Cyclotella cryptica TaxID=29204 RepID=A0ABD3QB45_9STRA
MNFLLMLASFSVDSLTHLQYQSPCFAVALYDTWLGALKNCGAQTLATRTHGTRRKNESLVGDSVDTTLPLWREDAFFMFRVRGLIERIFVFAMSYSAFLIYLGSCFFAA